MVAPVPLLVTGGYDYQIVYWDAIHARPLGEVSFPLSQINCFAGVLRPSNPILLAGGYRLICSFDSSRSGSSVEPLALYSGHTGNVTDMEQHPFHSNRPLAAVVRAARSPVSVDHVRAIGPLFTGGEDATARIWDPRISSSSHLQLTLDDALHTVGFRLLTEPMSCVLGDHGGKIHIWDLAANKIRCSLDTTDSNRPVKSLDVSPDGRFLATVNFDGIVSVFSLFSGSSASGSPPSPVAHSAFPRLSQTFDSHDGNYDPLTFATVSADTTARIWVKPPLKQLQHSESEETSTDEFHSNSVLEDNEHQRHDNGYRSSGGMEHTTRSSNNGRVSSSLRHTESFCNFNPTSRLIDSTKPFSLTATLARHRKWVWDCAFSLDGRYLVTAGADTVARLWDVFQRSEVSVFSGGHTKPITSVLLADFFIPYSGEVLPFDSSSVHDDDTGHIAADIRESDCPSMVNDEE